MGARVVKEIPADPRLAQPGRQKKLRVAAYCRVSTDEEEQQGSFAIQVAYYTQKITEHEGWQLAGVFADEGISGVHAKNRTQFLAMVDLCKKKKIDLILTKSISRFARNTLDCIQYVRLLKGPGIPVIFEKEGIDTSGMSSEMLLACLSSFAQAESESISLNVARGKRMGYRQGRFAFRYANCLGYEKGPDGQPKIVPEEAAVIRMLFQRYLDGDSLAGLKQALESQGILSPTGRKGWSTQTILRILQNEKYMGDILLQKTYTANFLEGKTRKNNGELPQYYIENNHPGIVSRELFQQVQEEIARRKSKSPAAQKGAKTSRGRFTSKYALSERMVCGKCGSYYRRVTWDIHGRKQVVWRCINRLENGKSACPCSPSLPEDRLQEAIMRAVRGLLEGAEIGDALETALAGALPAEGQGAAAALRQEIQRKEKEFDQLLELAGEGESALIDRRLESVSQEVSVLQERLQDAVQRQSDGAKAAQTEWLLAALHEAQAGGLPYSDALVRRVVERIAVLDDGTIRIRFLDGVERVEKV